MDRRGGALADFDRCVGPKFSESFHSANSRFATLARHPWDCWAMSRRRPPRLPAPAAASSTRRVNSSMDISGLTTARNNRPADSNIGLRYATSGIQCISHSCPTGVADAQIASTLVKRSLLRIVLGLVSLAGGGRDGHGRHTNPSAAIHFWQWPIVSGRTEDPSMPPARSPLQEVPMHPELAPLEETPPIVVTPDALRALSHPHQPS